jgi:hypothetical protein
VSSVTGDDNVLPGLDTGGSDTPATDDLVTAGEPGDARATPPEDSSTGGDGGAALEEGIEAITGQDVPGNPFSDKYDEPAPESGEGAPPDPVLDGLTSAGTSTVPASDAFPTLHALIPEVGADGTVGPFNLKPPLIENNSITVDTYLGPGSAKLGVDDKGHLTAEIQKLPFDPSGALVPSREEARANLQSTVDRFNKLMDDKGVHLTDIKTTDGKLILTKEPNTPASGSGAPSQPPSP